MWSTHGLGVEPYYVVPSPSAGTTVHLGTVFCTRLLPQGSRKQSEMVERSISDLERSSQYIDQYYMVEIIIHQGNHILDLRSSQASAESVLAMATPFNTPGIFVAQRWLTIII